MARIRYALRSLAKAPLLSLVVIVSLGLGIGANTAIFSLLHQVVLASLPVEKPEELALLTSPQDFKSGRNSSDNSGHQDYIFSYPMFRGLETRAQGIAGLAGFRVTSANLAFRSQSVSGGAMLVSGGYFPLLGVKPLIGRAIAPEDDRPGGGNPVAVLGYGYWRDKLGGGADILNQPIHINGHIFTIVGVAPPAFHSTTLGQDPDVYVPMSFKPQLTPNWDGTTHWDDYWIYLLARRRPGQTLEQAAAALNSTYAGLVEQQAKIVPQKDARRTARFLKSRLALKDGRQGNSSFRDGLRTPVLILMAATVLVLLIAMANAANLLLARAAGRRRELAIRAAMGAGRGELMGQLLAEAMLLAVGGAVLRPGFGLDHAQAAGGAVCRRFPRLLPHHAPPMAGAAVRHRAFLWPPASYLVCILHGRPRAIPWPQRSRTNRARRREPTVRRGSARPWCARR